MFSGCRTSLVLKLLFTIVVTLFCALVAVAQNCGNCLGSAVGVFNDLSVTSSNPFNESHSVFAGAADTSDSWTIRKRVDEVMLFFTVTKGHKFVDDLTQQDVSVKDDNKPPAKVSAFGHQSDLPLRLGLLVDTSSSVQYRFSFEQEAASRFLRKIVRSQTDRAFVMGFTDSANLTQDYTGNPDELGRGISSLSSEGATALFDAVRASCSKLSGTTDQTPTARILVLLSDGDDNASKSTLKQAIETAQRAEVTIYTISTNNSSYSQPGDRILKDLAAQTGGQMFSRNNAKEMVKAFSAIEQEMRSRYALAYQPAELQEDGRFHRIEVKAHRLNEKFRVHARKGYYARLALSGN